MAIRNGFSRAMATIIDSHVTTLVSAVVLYIVGTDQIKGFAVTLIIGLLMSLFTAVFVARVIFDIAEKQRWLTQLKMMHVIGHTNIDFIRWRGPAIAGSVVIIAIGFVATWHARPGDARTSTLPAARRADCCSPRTSRTTSPKCARPSAELARRGRQQRGREQPRIQGRHVGARHQEGAGAAAEKPSPARCKRTACTFGPLATIEAKPATEEADGRS